MVVTFDDVVRVGHGNAAVANTDGASVLAGKPTARGRVLTLRLRPRLARGDYSVRWSIISDDGHPEEGVLAFGVGAHAAPPQSILTAATPLTWNDVVLRLLYYGGLLTAGGLAVFAAIARPLGDGLRRRLAHGAFFALLAAFVGGGGMLQAAGGGTRFALVLEVAVVVAAVGAAAAALAPMYERLLPLAQACGLGLLAAPTFAGHALDRNQPWPVSVPLDLAHVASAAVWAGGLVGLAFVLPRCDTAGAERNRVVGRFSRVALWTVVALALTGVGRAATELSAVHQAWSTSYGRALLIKTALFVSLVALGRLNRARLLFAFTRLRRSVLVELGLVLAVVGVVAVLTELRPGRDVPRAPARTQADGYVRSGAPADVSPPPSR